MSADYLDKDEFVPFAPSERGGETHVHHCKKGKNNDRLYIKRTDDDSIIAYCHHCGKRGISKLDGVRNISNFRSSKDKDLNRGVSNHLRLPTDYEKDFTKWPKEAKAWPMKYGITEDELNANHIGYSPYFARVVLPCFDEEGTLSQFQTRKIDGIDTTARYQRPTKYDTYIKRGSSPFNRLFRAKFTGLRSKHLYMDSTCCLVEDALSAIKCARFVEGSIALNGTSLDTGSILTLSKHYDDFIIFLDNDNPQVKKSQTKLKRRLELVCKGKVTIVYSDKDPKELSNRKLKEVLNV